jgi:hypothetical protein
MSITVLAIALIWSTVSLVTVAVCMATAMNDDAVAPRASRTTFLTAEGYSREPRSVRPMRMPARSTMTQTAPAKSYECIASLRFGSVASEATTHLSAPA